MSMSACRTRKPRRRDASRGTTVIEVLMAISILAIGAAGIFSLQKVTIVANRDARNLEVANQISRTWLDRLRMDGMKWNYPTPGNAMQDLGTDTQWLSTLASTTYRNTWFRPTDNTRIYGEHDVLGNDVNNGGAGPYCVNLRLMWIGTDQNLIRSEVRVAWARQGLQNFASLLPTAVNFGKICGDNLANPTDADAYPEVFHVVHAVTGIFKNVPK